jgi:hypothetical protein
MLFIATATFAKSGEINPKTKKAKPAKICQTATMEDPITGQIAAAGACCRNYTEAQTGAELLAANVELLACAE